MVAMLLPGPACIRLTGEPLPDQGSLSPLHQERAAGSGYSWTTCLAGLLLERLHCMEREGVPLSEVLAGLHEALGACQEVRYVGAVAALIGSVSCVRSNLPVFSPL